MIELSFESQKAVVDKVGAIVHTYDIDGESILYPRQLINGSYRGGSHVCLPNFGPDEKTDQSQHGYGRLVDWRVAASDESCLKLEHRQTEGQYAGLLARLQYKLSNRGLSMKLDLINKGQADLGVAPGFHPYFTVPGGVDTVMIGGKGIKIADTADTRWQEVDEVLNISLGSRHIKLASSNLNTLAVWSIHPDKYVCIEPTYAGNAHLSGRSEGLDVCRLQPGDSITIEVAIA